MQNGKNLDPKNKFLFVPGGPWISGKYWDRYLHEEKELSSSLRYNLLNHENEYNASTSVSRSELESNFNKFVSMNSCISGDVLIGHSYGAWLILSALSNEQLQRFKKVILVCMPFSNTRTLEFQNVLSRIRMTINSNDDFTRFFRIIAPLYFDRFNPGVFDDLFHESYMEGNLDFAFNDGEVIRLIQKAYALCGTVSFIFVENDRIVGTPWKEIKGNYFEVLPGASHFPMLEYQVEFTQSIKRSLSF